ncbi:MAG: hypothetical protein J0H68_01705 [Sphingobacteriia bacterium]|nr:hypothetical protein [Sphingobacteriia bacterium]
MRNQEDKKRLRDENLNVNSNSEQPKQKKQKISHNSISLILNKENVENLKLEDISFSNISEQNKPLEEEPIYYTEFDKATQEYCRTVGKIFNDALNEFEQSLGNFFNLPIVKRNLIIMAKYYSNTLNEEIKSKKLRQALSEINNVIEDISWRITGTLLILRINYISKGEEKISVPGESIPERKNLIDAIKKKAIKTLKDDLVEQVEDLMSDKVKEKYDLEKIGNSFRHIITINNNSTCLMW